MEERHHEKETRRGEGTEKKRGGAAEDCERKRGENGAGETTDARLRRDQAGAMATADHSKERRHSETVEPSTLPAVTLKHFSPPSSSFPAENYITHNSLNLAQD